MSNPDQIREQLSAYADGQLDDEETVRVEQAIRADESLARDLEAIRATRNILRQTQTLSPSPDFVDRVLAEARRRNILPAPQQAAPSAAQPARKGWLAAWPIRLAAAASLVLAAAAGGTVAVLSWTAHPAAPLAGGPPGGEGAVLAKAEGEHQQLTGTVALKRDAAAKAGEDWAYAEKGATNRQFSTPAPEAPAPETPVPARLRATLADAKGNDPAERKTSGKAYAYAANAKDIAGDVASGGTLSLGVRRGRGAANELGDDLRLAQEEVSPETVQRLELHVTHLAAARREVAAILASVAAPAPVGEPARGKAAPAPAASPAAPEAMPAPAPAPTGTAAAAPPVAGTGVVTGGGPAARAMAPASVPTSPAGPAIAALSDRIEPLAEKVRIDQGDRPRPTSSPTQRASVLASLRGLACEVSPGAGVWQFIIVDTPERIDRISQAVRRVGTPDKDGESYQRLCVAVVEATRNRPTALPPGPAKPAPAATAAKGPASAPPAQGEPGGRHGGSIQSRADGQVEEVGRAQVAGLMSQSQSAPYHVAEIQRRPEPRLAEALRLLIVTLRAEPAPPASNANPDRNLAK